MGQALYRKYRSKNLDEVVGQEHITTTLKNALASGKISHAYLLTGPKGVGKTSVARILAYAVNKLPYDEEATHLDIIEIDAASNRRIDEIRELRDKVHIAPSSATYKVYIIDEVHMLTKEAFNALLKTLEEPPAHVIFILATTEAHKLPETIISRTQHFSFKPIESAQVIAHLSTIAKAEKLDVDDAALELIAKHGEGSFRDSISLLDQASTMGSHIGLQEVQTLLGIAPGEVIDQLITTLQDGTPKSLLDLLTTIHGQGYQAPRVASQLAERLRQGLIEGRTPLPGDRVTELLARLIDVAASSQPERLLEIILLEEVLEAHPVRAELSQAKAADLTIDKPVETERLPATQEPKKPVEKTETSLEAKPKESNVKEMFELEDWPNVLALIKKKHNTLYGILRMAQPELADQTLTLGFEFGFHQRQVSEAKNRQIVADTIQELTSLPLKISFIVINKKSTKPTPPPQNLETISNIFGGGEVLD